MKDVLLDVLKARASAPAWEWAQKGLQAAQAPVNRNTVIGYHAGASRRMGKVALALTPAEAAHVDPKAGSLSHWGADEAYRALLLLTLAHLPPDDYADLVLAIYKQGDAREQESWLRGLALLPGAERFLATAIDSCRTNILLQFQAIACENPYPMRYFPEPNFNQMVLKALFNTVALERIVGLRERLNAELSRMADDYAAEREAAGRAVPVDLWLAQAPHATPAALQRTARYLAHKEADHRYWAAVGLGLAKGNAAQDLLAKRRKVEKDARVRSALDAALQRASA
ncbi:MAG TPA: EboA domain-containing protein [bacterium]